MLFLPLRIARPIAWAVLLLCSAGVFGLRAAGIGLAVRLPAAAQEAWGAAEPPVPPLLAWPAGTRPVTCVPGYRSGPRITADAAVLMDRRTGWILFGRNERQRRAPASTTKVMTALLGLERGDLDVVCVVSGRAASVGGSSLHLATGDSMTLGEVLRGTMLRSGNDGCVAIAEHISGSVENFVRLMNMRAAELGACDTRFRNPHGLPAAGHYSTALDLAIIASHALRYARFREIVSTREEDMVLERKEAAVRRRLANTNKLLWTFPGAEGVKTGTTSEAGRCLIAAATRGDLSLVSVVLHSDDRWEDSARLLDYGFREFTYRVFLQKGERVPAGPAWDGLTLVAASDLAVVYRRAGPQPSLAVNLDPSPRGLLRGRGSLPARVVGRASVLLGGTEIAGTELLAWQEDEP